MRLHGWLSIKVALLHYHIFSSQEQPRNRAKRRRGTGRISAAAHPTRSHCGVAKPYCSGTADEFMTAVEAERLCASWRAQAFSSWPGRQSPVAL
jgi:hypothetical protein